VISWERGITVPVLYTLRRLAAVLGVTLEYLMEGM
jgi:transcriptional regulator with XRE-family HTH domain